MGKDQYIYRFVLGIRLGARAKKEYSCFQKCGWREKLLPDGRNLFFFNRFSGDILFSSLVSFAFFAFLFCCCCCCCCWVFLFYYFFCLFIWFLKLKIYILIHIGLYGRVIFSPDQFPEPRLQWNLWKADTYGS